MAFFPAGTPATLVGFDTTNVVHTFAANDKTWTATEDCYICGYIYYAAAMGSNTAYVSINNVAVASFYIPNTAFTGAVCAPVKKGQIVVVNSNEWHSIKCYGLNK